MNSQIFLSFVSFCNTVKTVLFSIASSLFIVVGFTLPATIATSTPLAPIEIATSSAPKTTVSTSTPAKSVKKEKIPVPVVTPKPVISVVTMPPPIATTSELREIGTTTLAIKNVPLLSGGVARAGTSVPIAYLQVTNIGKAGTILKGVWVTQRGTAPGSILIGLSTVDDSLSLRDHVGGTEGDSPFIHGVAVAPIDAYFAPHQMRLFTIKAMISQNVSQNIGSTLMIDVTGIESAATSVGRMPIPGVTWTIAQ